MDLTKTIDSRELKLSFEADKITRNNLNNTVLVIPGQIEYFAMSIPPKVGLNAMVIFLTPIFILIYQMQLAIDGEQMVQITNYQTIEVHFYVVGQMIHLFMMLEEI